MMRTGRTGMRQHLEGFGPSVGSAGFRWAPAHPYTQLEELHDPQ